MRDGRLRRNVKRIARWHFYVNLVVVRALSRGSRHRLAGDCERCAKCCEAPSMQVSRVVWWIKPVQRLFLWWQEGVNGFVLTGRGGGRRELVFRCTHFDWDTRSCDSYESRPGMCRDYPRTLLDQPNPDFLPGCGYRPVAPNADALLRELRRQNLPAGQLIQLKRKLRLE